MRLSTLETSLLGLAALTAWAWPAMAAQPGDGPPSTAPWARVLELHARDGGLDYAALAADRGDLDAYLAAIADARPAEWTQAEQIAFWCNAYNAAVVKLVLDRYPGIRSVKEVDGFFDKLKLGVAGGERTLDEIETRARDLGDPRVHFAVVCASTSCPGLRPEPYLAARLEEQLEEQTRRFLADPAKGLRYDAQANVLRLSSIFKWYAGDFTGGSTAVAFFLRGKVTAWLLPHLPADLAAVVEERQPSVRYLDYDWTLNDRPGS